MITTSWSGSSIWFGKMLITFFIKWTKYFTRRIILTMFSTVGVWGFPCSFALFDFPKSNFQTPFGEESSDDGFLRLTSAAGHQGHQLLLNCLSAENGRNVRKRPWSLVLGADEVEFSETSAGFGKHKKNKTHKIVLFRKRNTFLRWGRELLNV